MNRRDKQIKANIFIRNIINVREEKRGMGLKCIGAHTIFLSFLP